MATEDLTSIVTSTLEARGVLNRIRAELRANVFSAIQEQQGTPDSAPSAALEALRHTGHGQLAAKLMHELLLGCGLDYSLAVLLPEAGFNDLELPDRQALATTLGLDGAGEEPLLAQLVRHHMQGGRAPAPQAATRAEASDGARELGGALRDVPPLGKPSGGGAGGPLGELPPLGGRPRGGDDDQGSREEERRLDAIESKLAGLAGMPLTTARPATAPAQSRLQPVGAPPPAPMSTGAADFEDELVVEEDIDDDFEDYVDSDELGSSANLSAPVVAGGQSGGPSLSASRIFDRSMDESMSPSRLAREMQGFDHTEEVEPLRAAPTSVPALQAHPRSAAPSLAPLHTPRGGTELRLSGTQTL